MDKFLNSLPRWALVGGALGVGLIAILVINPPHTACDSQFEIFQKSETPFLYKDAAKKFADETDFQKTMQICKDKNGPGACFQYFENLKFLIRDVKTVGLQCRPTITGRAEVSAALWNSLTFIYELAWGPTPPASYLDRTGWLDSVHVSIFCDLQKIIHENFSEEDYVAFREKTLAELPQASTIGRAETWNRSLFTLKCP